MVELRHIKGLNVRIARTRWELGALSFLSAFWPLLLFVAIFLLLALTGLHERASTTTGAALTLGSVIAAILLAMRGWRRWRGVTEDEAVRVLDAQSDLRPIASLSDRPATLSGSAHALWTRHSERLAAAAAGLRAPDLGPRWRAIDPYWLRAAAPAALLLAFAAAGSDGPRRIASALSPDYGALIGAQNIRVEAWITPPAYSGRAPVFLKEDLDLVRVPAGSQLTLRSQARSAPSLKLEGEETRRIRMPATPDGAYEVKALIEGDTRVSLHWWGERQAWQVNASPDAPPSALFVETPIRTPQDRTEFTWAVTDDYGVTGLDLVIRLVDPHPAATDAEDRATVPMAAVAPKEADEQSALDLTRHRWAGLEVEVRLEARDGAGQTGLSAPHVFVLPEKLFLQPLAKAAQESRVTVLREPRPYAQIEANPSALADGEINTAPTARLEAAPDDIRRAALMLDALTYEPTSYFRDYAVFLGLRMANSILESAADKSEADAVDPILWAVALKAEYGSAADALRALQAARRALEQALRDGASEDEIRRLMQAFKEAAENYVAAKLAEAIANGLPEEQAGTDGEAAGGGPSFGGQDFSDMLEALQDLTETGASDQARQLLSDITNLLENLQFQQGGSGGEGGFPGLPGEGGGEDGEPSDEEQAMSDTLERLSDLLREQRELNDDTLAEGRGERRPGSQGQGQGAPGERQEDGEGGGGDLADRQESLGDALEDFAGGIAERGGPQGEDGVGVDADTLAAIEESQRRAADALRRGAQGLAELEQERATRLLRDLSRDVAEQLDALRDGVDGQAETDPLGRRLGGANDSDNVAVPDAEERRRAKDILEELRRRYGDAEEETERDYLERLLDRF